MINDIVHIMDSIMVPIDLRERTLAFSKQIINYAKSLKRDTITYPLLNQLIKSSTSIGANFIEAKNGSSVRDFRNKVFISKKEASETLYWLKVLEEIDNSDKLYILQKECQEIVLILQKIINTTKAIDT